MVCCTWPAFREAVELWRAEGTNGLTCERAWLVQRAVIFDRIFRFAITGTRVRNYDAIDGQLLFARMHQKGVLHWTDTQLTIDWDAPYPTSSSLSVTRCSLAPSRAIQTWCLTTSFRCRCSTRPSPRK